MTNSNALKIDDLILKSRLFVGTAGYPNQQTMLDAIEASGSDFVTVSIRRTSLENYQDSPIEALASKYNILPNTAGCETAKDAILTAQLAREALETDWIKLEIIGCRKTLYPDVEGLLEASEVLVKQGFKILPYCTDDPIICQKLVDIGCKAVMPLGSPIGTGLGICNPYNIELICNTLNVACYLGRWYRHAERCNQSNGTWVLRRIIKHSYFKSRRPSVNGKSILSMPLKQDIWHKNQGVLSRNSMPRHHRLKWDLLEVNNVTKRNGHF